jgi:single-strand DNA-binding protein
MSSPVTIVGNLTRDPDLRFTASGRGVTSFGVAVNRRWMNKTTNDWEEQVSFFNVTAWAELGENVAASLTKGNRVIVTGRLEQRSYTTKEGDERSTVEIVADSIGPDLRWATCTVERTERTTAPQQASAHPADTGPF